MSVSILFCWQFISLILVFAVKTFIMNDRNVISLTNKWAIPVVINDCSKLAYNVYLNYISVNVIHTI